MFGIAPKRSSKKKTYAKDSIFKIMSVRFSFLSSMDNHPINNLFAKNAK